MIVYPVLLQHNILSLKPIYKLRLQDLGKVYIISTKLINNNIRDYSTEEYLF